MQLMKTGDAIGWIIVVAVLLILLWVNRPPPGCPEYA